MGFMHGGSSSLSGSKSEMHQVGDILLDRTSKLPFKITEEVMLNDIPHVKLKCQSPDDGRTKTLSRSALGMNFQPLDIG